MKVHSLVMLKELFYSDIQHAVISDLHLVILELDHYCAMLLFCVMH